MLASHKALKEYKKESKHVTGKESKYVIGMALLAGVAYIRFAMLEVESILLSYSNDHTFQPNQQQQQLMQAAEEICTDPEINTTAEDAVGPAMYLAKLIVRQYGFSTLNNISKICKWVIPKGLHIADQVCFF